MNAQPASILDLTEARRATKRAALLARTRAHVPERREKVLHRFGIVWRQYPSHLRVVLAAKVAVELRDDPHA